MSPSAAHLVTHDNFVSAFLPGPRRLSVYVPPSYDDTIARFPVLYLHDGQNLFDPETAYLKGQHWRVGETVSALIEEGRLTPLVIVGIHHAGVRRLHEYTPTHDRKRGGGEAGAYARMLIDEIKPFIDRHYRTWPDAAHTGLGGSSLGGLVSLYLGLKRPDVFSRAAALSPSVWWDRRSILKTVREARPKPALRVWLDIGTNEGLSHVENTRLLKAGLLGSGWVDGDDLHYEEVPGGTHSERAWAERFGRVVEYLFR